MKYKECDLVRIAKRENNAKRSYLVVNPLQGKHIPVSPARALELFISLADAIRDKYIGENLLLVGFAETATAIGVQVAISLEARYIHTTREDIRDVEYLFFSEEHSHATEQKLVKGDIDDAVKSTDRIIFVEDEVTTGKTILNIISILEKMYPRVLKFAVASLLNGMSEEHLTIYKEKDINLHYLVKTDHSTYEGIADKFEKNGKYFECMENECVRIHKISVHGLNNARRLVDALQYKKACKNFWKTIAEKIGNITKKKILVVGTEEFMYPALFVASKLEALGNDVRCHSTTRSPIEVSRELDYPLHNRYELCSLYDAERKTFIYDIDSYDYVLVVTDAPETETKGLNTLINALSIQNTNITLVRWC